MFMAPIDFNMVLQNLDLSMAMVPSVSNFMSHDQEKSTIHPKIKPKIESGHFFGQRIYFQGQRYRVSLLEGFQPISFICRIGSGK